MELVDKLYNKRHEIIRYALVDFFAVMWLVAAGFHRTPGNKQARSSSNRDLDFTVFLVVHLVHVLLGLLFDESMKRADLFGVADGCHVPFVAPALHERDFLNCKREFECCSVRQAVSRLIARMALAGHRWHCGL